MIYTHSHVDHYGGVRGVIDEADVKAGKVAVIAPDGFMEAVSGENVLAGLPMGRRAQFQFGTMLPRGPRGQVDAGLGKGIARGSTGLIAPTMSIVQPVEEHTIDGIRIVFQLAPETEAPAEMHMFYPQLGVLNMAENACPLLHNFIPLARRRGARSAHLGQVHRRCHRDVCAADRRHDRPASLAGVGPRGGRSIISNRSATSTSTSTTRPCA